MDNLFPVKSALFSGSGSQGPEQPCSIKNRHTHNTPRLDPVCELGNVLSDKLQVIDESSETSSESPSDEDGSSGSSGLNNEKIDNHNLNIERSSVIASKYLHKCATFPVSSFSEEKSPETPPEDCKLCSRSLSMPTTRKLVSAMKGAREKEGVPQKKLSVSWAPDVYDPPPTSVSHYPKKKNYQQYSKSHKKHGKGKHKGKNVRGGGSGLKEKKHHRKTGGRSDQSSDSFGDCERLHNYKSSLELHDFNDPGIGSPDPNCGSSFLGQAGGNMHYVY